ncbi:MAG: hypothetical protein KDC82_00380, partial [Bacteroidetes bacterium]|nr:hypothetical protein [Bacteroidota bacterium]
LKSIDNNPTSLRFSNTGSNDIIIIIDELDGSIIVKDENNKELFTSDKLARFAIGKENAKNTLHIYSDTINPSIRLEREGYLFDYIFGFNENSSAFVLQRDSVIGGNSDILSVDTVGDVTINSSNKVNIFPGVKTGSIEVENEITGSSFTLSAHEDGTPFWVNGLNVMDMIGAYQDTFQLTDTDIHWAVRNHKGSSMSSAATNIVYIEIGEAGTYEVYYRVTVRGDANAFQFSEIELHKANGAGAYSYVANSQSNAPHPKLSPIPGGYEAFYNQVVHTRTMTLDLAAGDRLKLMGRTFGPTSIPLVYVNADGGEFIIRKLD